MTTADAPVSPIAGPPGSANMAVGTVYRIRFR